MLDVYSTLKVDILMLRLVIVPAIGVTVNPAYSYAIYPSD